MTDLTLAPATATLPVIGFCRVIVRTSKILAVCVAVFAAGFLLCSALPLLDNRLLLGVSVWEKPAKFFLSLGVHFATVAWAISLLTVDVRQSRAVRGAVRLMTGAAVMELVVIVARAARGEASHFNVGTPFDAAVYAIMGVGSLVLTFTAGYLGYRIWRNRQGDVWRLAGGFGLMLGVVLATLTAGYMSSLTGGDLRVAHFVGLHAMQVLPLAALSGKPRVVYGAAVAVTVLTMLTFVQAVMGVPLVRG
jgi:hypothetical protein